MTLKMFQKLSCTAGMAAAMMLALSGCGDSAAVVPSVAPQMAAAPISVATAAVVRRPLPRYLQTIGELRSGLDSAVASDAAGKVVEAPIERGTVVEAGDLLIKLDDRQAKLSLREAKAGLAQAQARLKLASAEWKRNEPLAKTRAIAEADFQRFTADRDSAQADVEAAQARCDTAEKAVEDTLIRAPFSGTVAERLVAVGEYVQASTQVARLVATDKLRLLMYVPETSVGQVKEGQKVTFQVPAFPDRRFEATVKYIGAVVREATRDLLVEAEAPNPESLLRQGMFADGQLLTGEAPTLAVPSDAIRMEGGVSKTLAIANDQIEERLVDIGQTHENWTEVLKGLSEGEVVVTKPGADAVDGARIKIANQ